MIKMKLYTEKGSADACRRKSTDRVRYFMDVFDLLYRAWEFDGRRM